MFFDCNANWMECRSDAPWQIRWKARLRRVQPMERLIATGIEPGIVATLSRVFEAGGGALGDKLFEKLRIPKTQIKMPKTLVAKVEDTWYFDFLTRDIVHNGLYQSGAFDGAGQFVISHSRRNMTVH
jgi:hypothetical protein